MKTSTLVLTVITFAAFSCNKLKTNKGTPECVNSKITEFSKTCCKTGAMVDEYQFQEKTVYAFDPGICGGDLATEVTDANCVSLGFLGGITGNTKINNEDFSKAERKQSVWSN